MRSRCALANKSSSPHVDLHEENVDLLREGLPDMPVKSECTFEVDLNKRSLTHYLTPRADYGPLLLRSCVLPMRN